MRFCYQCGFELHPNSIFCGGCGLRLVGESLVDDVPEIEGEEEGPDEFPLRAGDVWKVPEDIPYGTYRYHGSVEIRDQRDEQVVQEGAELFEDTDDYALMVLHEKHTSVRSPSWAVLLPIDLMPRLEAPRRGWVAGALLVGNDLEPGEYSIQAVDISDRLPLGYYYWSRTDSLLTIIENDYQEAPSGQFRIEPTDFAVIFTGRLTRIGD